MYPPCNPVALRNLVMMFGASRNKFATSTVSVLVIRFSQHIRLEGLTHIIYIHHWSLEPFRQDY